MALAEAVGTKPDGFYTLDELAKARGTGRCATKKWLETQRGIRTAKCRIDGRVVTVYGV